MSSLIYGRWKQYFQVPIDPRVENLGPSAFRYYVFLCREMNVHSAVELRCSNAEIAQATGIKDHKTLSKARAELESTRLILCRRVPPGVFAHIMLDQSGNPIPPPPDRRGIRHYETDTVATRKISTSTRSAPSSLLAKTRSSPNADQITTCKCRTHGTALHWKRGEDWICETYHPNPHSQKPWHPPTAKEIGFK